MRFTTEGSSYGTYGGRYMYLDISETTNPITNKSTLTWTLVSTGGQYNYYDTGATTVKINGTQVYYKARTYWDSYEFPAATGSVSGTLTVDHDSNGDKTITVVFQTVVFWGQDVLEDYGGSMTLTHIDRTAPTVTHSVTNITANSLKINASASVTCDVWEYSVNGGSSYTQFSTSSGTSASYTLTGLTPNTTYNIRVRARKKSNQVKGSSTSAQATTLGGSIVTSASDAYIDVASPSLQFSLTIYDSTYYHKLNVKNENTTVFSVNLGQYTAGTSQQKTYSLTSDQRTSMLNQIPNAASFVATIEIVTYSDSGYTTQVGDASSNTATMGTTSETSKPTFSAFTYSDTRALTVAATEDNQVLIKGYSTLQVVAAAGTAKNGASIASYSVEIGDVSGVFTTTTMNVGVVGTSGDLSLKVTCIDSRGYSTSVTDTVKVIDYVKPRLSSFTVRRKNEIEDIIQLDFNGSFSAIKADGTNDTNSLTYAGFYYKRTDDTSWSNYVSILSDVTVSPSDYISFSSNQLMVDSVTPLSLNEDYSWDFHLVIRDELDSLSSYDLYVTIPQGTPLVTLRKRNNTYNFPRVGIDCPDPTEALDVGGNIKMNGQTVMGFIKQLSNESLNSIKKSGLYSQNDAATNVTSGTNYPVTEEGLLEVLSIADARGDFDTFVFQRYTPYTLTYVYIRCYANSTWSAWRKIETTALS